MTPTNHFSADIFSTLINLTLSTSLVCVVSILLTKLLFKNHPAIRYLVCLTGLIWLLICPILAVLPVVSGRNFLTIPVAEIHYRNEIKSSRGETFTEPVKLGEANSQVPWQVALIGAIWFTGCALQCFRIAQGITFVRSLRKEGVLYRPAGWDKTRESLSKQLNFPFPPVFISKTVGTPVAIGIFRPVVLLPQSLPESLSMAQMRQVLLHEGAHISHRHALGGAIERSVRMIFWLHPLLPLLCKEFGRAREEVCDNVASQEIGAACYARTLLALAQGNDTAPPIFSALALQGPESGLENRIEGLLDPRRNRMTSVSKKTKFAVLTTIAVAFVGASSLRVISQEKPAPKRPPIVEKIDSAEVRPSKSDTQLDVVVSGVPRTLHLKYAPKTVRDSSEKSTKIAAEKREQTLSVAKTRVAKSSASVSSYRKLKLDAEQHSNSAGNTIKLEGSKSELDAAKFKAEKEAQEAERREKLKSNAEEKDILRKS